MAIFASSIMAAALATGIGPAGAGGGALVQPVWNQVHIESRVVIRIFRSPGVIVAPPPPVPIPAPVVRRPSACLPLSAIASVAESPAANQIMLILRDRRIVTAELSHTCTARDFYPGFYTEPAADGMLCVGRDPIHSRAGATCLVTRLQLAQ